MDVANFWLGSCGEKRGSGGVIDLGRGSLKCLPGLVGNRYIQPTSFGKYIVMTETETKPSAVPAEPKPLNAHAEAWSPFGHGAPEADRCLFVTFSNGYPLTEEEIAKFFINEYGGCLERVYVHRPQPKNYRDIYKQPQFGKVIFKASLIPQVITGCGTKQAKFMVNGKPLWCKKFDYNKTQAFRQSGNYIS